ncbi:MAG: hypothetical protein ACI924_001234 [Flavobacterium sp.]|jgi:hypothetical protein
MIGLINSNWKEFKKENLETNDDFVNGFINGFDEKIKKIKSQNKHILLQFKRSNTIKIYRK